MASKKIVDAITEWFLKDPKAVAKIRESMRPHLEQAWAQGYIVGRNEEIEDRQPNATDNPYSLGADK